MRAVIESGPGAVIKTPPPNWPIFRPAGAFPPPAAGTGWTDEQHCLVFSDELTRCERFDPHCVERWLEVEVEFLKRLEDRETCGSQPLVDALVFSCCEFVINEPLKKLQIAELLVNCRLMMCFDDGCGVTEA